MRVSRVFVALSLVAACAGEREAVRTASAPKAPAWLTQVRTSPDALFFVGSKEGAASLEDGKAAATDAARGEAAKYVGVKIRATFADAQSTRVADNETRQDVSAQAQALLQSAEVSDLYFEKISREGYDRYDVWVLVRFPRAEVERERTRQRDEKRQIAIAGLARLREGQEREVSGALLAALARYREVARTVQDLAADVETGDAAIATAAALRQKAQDLATALVGRVRRAVVVAPELVAGPLTRALAAKGFAARVDASGDEAAALKAAAADGTPWVIVVRATTTPGGNVFQQVAASASLDVRALDARSGEVVASAQKLGKGIGRTPQAAQQAAANEAGQGAGAEVSAALVAREGAIP